MKNKKFFLLIFTFIFISLVFHLSLSFVGAQEPVGVGDPGRGEPAGGGIIGGKDQQIRMIDNPLGDSEEARDPRKLLGRIIGAVLGIVGSLALAIFVFGGFTWMTASGNEDKIKKGRDMIVWAVFGLAVIFLSYVLVEFVLGAFVGT